MLRPWEEDDDILHLSSIEEPLAMALQWMSGKLVTVRYWITDKPCSRDEAVQSFLMMAMGQAYVNIESRYSEITGYLYTDESLNVGGHDLMREFRGHVGKWLILEIESQ